AGHPAWTRTSAAISTATASLFVNAASRELVRMLWKPVTHTIKTTPAVIAADSLGPPAAGRIPRNTSLMGNADICAIHSIRNTAQQSRSPYAGTDPNEFF